MGWNSDEYILTKWGETMMIIEFFNQIGWNNLEFF